MKLINGVYTWHDEYSHATFPGKTFWCAGSYWKRKPLHKLQRWLLDLIYLVKGKYAMHRPENIFGEVTWHIW